MFTMTVLSNSAGPVTIALEGNVASEALPEIQRLVDGGSQASRNIVLDLAEVTLMDRAAVRFIAGLLQEGVEVLNCPVYIKDWILREITHEP